MKGQAHPVSLHDADSPKAGQATQGTCPFHAAAKHISETHSPDNARAADAADNMAAGRILEQTRIWVEKAVIGQNFCPFANAVLRKNRLRIHISEATEPAQLLEDLRAELQLLLSQPEDRLETSLLVCPRMLHDFLDFNDFLNIAEGLLSELGLDGTIQLASFHPRYQFAGTRPDDISNATNQSPYPTLHLLRETSIDRAVAAWGEDTDRIFENNIARLEALGPEGWRQLRAQWQDDETSPETPDSDTPYPP